MKKIKIQPMTAAAFAPFGDLIDSDRSFDYQINNGNCDRYNALATPEAIGTNAKSVVSLIRARPYKLPLTINVMERHPFGSQAFVPLGKVRFLVVVAEDDNGSPVEPLAFLTQPGQGVNYHRNVWHCMLSPLEEETDFLVVDRKGEEKNLEEFTFEDALLIVLSQSLR